MIDSMLAPEAAAAGDELPIVLIALLKGVVYRETDPRLWSALLRKRSEALDYMAKLALVLHVDELEGDAYLRNRDVLPSEGDAPPRLIPRRQLGYNDSLLLALLRKKLAEFDASATDSRLILTVSQMYEMLALFLPEAADETRLTARVDSSIKRLFEMGFLRKLQVAQEEESYEVMRILKAFVDAEWLNGLEAGLAEYKAHGTPTQPS